MADDREKLSLARAWLQGLAGVIGAGAATYGAYLIYRPAGFIVGGLLLMAFVVYDVGWA